MPPPQGTPNPLEGPADYTFTEQVHSDTYPAIDPTKADLFGKHVFVSGASKGLGRSIAISFAKAGASKIAIGARSDLSETEKAIKDAVRKAGRPEPDILKLKLDITSKESVEAAAERIKTEFGGRIDVLINNAGVLSGMTPISSSDPDIWWSNFQANLLGPYLTCRSFLPMMGPGAIIFNISSVGAHCVGPTLSGYQTSKLAVLRLTEFLAAENPDVTSIALHPGNMLTDIVGKGDGMDEGLKAVFTETTELCSDGLVFLTSKHAESEGVGWLSGRYVNVTWDLPELVGSEKKKEIVDGDKLKVRLVV